MTLALFLALAIEACQEAATALPPAAATRPELRVEELAGWRAHLRPSPDVESAYAEKVRFRARRQEQYRLLRDRPAVTRDGHRVSLLMNAGLLVDLPHLVESGAEGIGLFRTELQFMIAAKLPNLSEQRSLYASVMDTVGDRPVTFLFVRLQTR